MRFAWLWSIFGRRKLSRGERRSLTRKRTSVPPRLERLEDRLAPAILTVNSTADNTTDTSALNLREAIALVNSAGNPSSLGQNTMPSGWASQISSTFGSNDTIQFSSALKGATITLNGTALPSITKSVAIIGLGANQLTINGNNQSGVFTVLSPADVSLSSLKIEGGSAPAGRGYGGGGAVFNSGTLMVSQAAIFGNAGGLGGGLFNSVGTLTVNNSTIADNTASDGSVTGSGGFGGGIYNAQGTLKITNSTFYGNSAQHLGGGIDNLGTLTVIDSTLAGNSAATGGGIDNTSSSKISLQNTIVATNIASTAADVSGAATGKNNLIGQNVGLSGISNNDAGHDHVGTSASPLDPLLSPLANYGGSVSTLALLGGSPAIHAGVAISGITTDERGLPRPAVPDIGAFQTQPIASFGVSAPAAAIAGSSFPVTIAALDQYGNPVTNYSGSVTLASSDNQQVYLSASTIKLANGTATVWITLNNPNSVTISATSGNLTGKSGTIVVNPAVASFTVSVPTAVTAGTSFNATITAVDRFGNTVSGYNGPVTLASSDGQTISGLPTSLTLSNGSAQVAVSLDKANTVTLMASAGSVQGSSASILVSPAAATSFTVSAPSTAGAGESFSVTLTAEDSYGNVVTNYSGPVILTSSDGQTVTVSPATLAWNNGTASATVTLNNLTPNPITLTATAGSVSGSSCNLVIESTASEAISNGLAALVNWAANQNFPLVGTATSIQNALQLGLLNPINTYLAKNTPTSSGFLTLLQGLSAQYGNLAVTVAPSSVQETVNGNQVMFSLDFQAIETSAASVQSLGTKAGQLGIRLDPATEVSVTTSLNFNFTFGVDQTPGLTAAQAFFLNAPAGGLSASVAINAVNINSAINIGFLGAQTSNGSIQMNATAANTASLSTLKISGLQNLTLNLAGSLNVVLPVQARLGSQSASGTLIISDSNLSNGAAPTIQWQGFAGWQNFTTVGPDAVLAMLNQFGGQLGQLAEQTWTTNLPFLGSMTLAQAANLSQSFQEAVTNQIASWSNTLQKTVTEFTTAQELTSLLAQVLDIPTSQVNVQFSPTTNDLTYHLAFTSHPFSDLLAQTLQVNLNQGGLANASLSSSQLSLVPTVTASLTFGMDLTPLGRGFMLTPQTTLSSLNGGAGVRTNGTSDDLNVTLSDGTSFAVGLQGVQTIQGAINAIQTATNNRVQVMIDPISQAGLDITQLANTPIALDFAQPANNLALTTTLASLNGGIGIQTNGAGVNDLEVMLTDGTSFDVSLGQAATIQDLINAFQTASGGKVQVSINPANPNGLLVTQAASVISNGSSVFAILPINGSPAAGDLGIQHLTVSAPNSSSYAAADLGILGADAASTGTITGGSLSGDSLQQHVFIQNASLTASIVGKISQAAGSASLNAVGLQMTNGSGTLNLQGSLTIQGPTNLQQLANALNGTTPLSSIVTSQVSGSANLNLPLGLQTPLTGYSLPSGAEIAVNWPDVTNPASLSVTVTPALAISTISMKAVMQGLQSLDSFVQTQATQASSLLNQPISGLGISLGSIVSPAASLGAALNSLNVNPPATIGALVSQFNALMGQSALSVSFNNTTNALQLNLNYNFAKTQNVSLNFNLSGLGELAEANGSDPISMSVNGSVQLGMNIDFNQPANPQYYLQDSSKIQVGAQISSTGVTFSTTVGPLGLYINGGSVYLDNGTHTANNPAIWTLALNPNLTNHLWSFASAANETTGSINGQINISLPTFFPNPSQPLDPTTPSIELHINLGNPSVPILGHPNETPNFSAALNSIQANGVNGIMNQLVDGWNGFMRSLESDMTQQLVAQNIPVVGTTLQQAVGFLQKINDKVTTELQSAPQLAATSVQQALYDALGPNGLNILVKADGSSNPTLQDVGLEYLDSNGNQVADPSLATDVHYLLHLNDQVNEVLSTGTGVGLPGLGLSFNGNLALTGAFTATLGFGISTDAGFYVDSSDKADLSFGVNLMGNATAQLGFLQFQITNPNPEIMAGDLSVNLNVNPDQYGRVSLANLTNLGASNFSYGFGVDPSLKLDAGFSNQPDLPNLTTTLAFTWNDYSSNFDTQAFLKATGIDLTQPSGLSFSDVTLDMGSFFDNIANEIGNVLKPIQPFADILTAPLPVLSQLSGHNVDLIDLAGPLGVSPGTQEFVDAVLAFVGNDPLTSLSQNFDLGSFTLDPSAAANPADQGNMSPTSVNLNSQTKQDIANDLSNTPTGFEVPILSDPTSAFQLLLGKDVPLFTYTTPTLGLSFGFSQFFPVIGPLGVNLEGQLGASAQAGFGFDTAGFREFAADDYRDPSLILDGLYVDSNATQLQLDGSIAAYAAVDLGILSAGVGGGLYAAVDLNPHDPSGTGHVHLQDLESDFQKGTIFDVSGALQAFLDAYVTLDLGLFSHTWTFDIAHVTLATIGQSPQVPSKTPVLAQMQNNVPDGGSQKDVLRLNIGSYAADRLYNSATDPSKPSDGHETLTVTQGPTANSVYVSGYGVTNQLYTFAADNLPHVIVADGLAGNDNVTINLTSDIDVNLAAGAGQNTFKVQTGGNVTLTGGTGTNDLLEVDGAANATLNGGSGSETLKVTGNVPAVLNAGSGNNTLDASADSANNVVLIGGTGNDTLYGGSGSNDLLFADGAAQQNGSWVPVSGFNLNKQDLLVGGSGSGQMLFGGAGSDILVGGSGANQQLIAGSGDNTQLFGGTGVNQVVGANTALLPGSGSGKNDRYFANSNVDQTLVGGSGDGALLAVGWTPGSNYSETASGDPVGWQLNAKGQLTPGDNQDGVDIHPNADGTPNYHTYTMYAGSGNNTLMIGGLGNDFMYGSVGTASIYGGGGPGTKMIYAGSGDTSLYGGSPLGGDFSFTNSAGNTVSLSYASTGMHYLFGGPGRDNLYGGDGINVGPYMLAGDDMDTQGENFLYAGTGQSTLWGDSTVHNELHAGTGNDTLYAGTGGDLLVAGSGIDVLQGGPGNDTFQLPFNPVTGTNTVPDSINGDGGIDTVSFLGSSVNPNIYMTVVQVGTATGTISGHTITGLKNFAGGISALSNLVPGEMVQGAGILPNTTIDSINLATGTVNLSNNVSTGGPASLTTTLTFSKYQATLSDLNAPVLTATATPGSNHLTGLSSTTGLVVGESVSGSGIAANTVITGIDAQNSIFLSTDVTANPANPSSSNSFTTSLSFPQIGRAQFTVPDSLANVALTGSQTPGTMYGQVNGSASNPSAEIDNLASTSMLAVGDNVQLSIPATPTSSASTVTATIVSIDSATSITISTPVPFAGTCQVIFPGVQAGASQIVVDPSVQRNMELYGGGGSNVLMAGSGNDILNGGPGNNTLYGGSGNDLLYGGLRLSGYTAGSTGNTLVVSELNTANLMPGYLVSGQGIPSDAAIASINGTSITLQTATAFNTPAGTINLTVMQPGAHEVLIAGSGSSELTAGNGTDVLIGGSVLRTGSDTSTSNSTTNALTHIEAGPAVLDANGNYQLASNSAGQDVLSAGSGNDLIVAAPNSAGAIIYGGSGNDILVGGGGQDIINGGSGQDTILGGNLFNIINSGSVAGSSTTISGGGGLNYETAGSGNDTLYDYADAATWNAASATASQVFHVDLVPPTPIPQLTPSQLDYENLIPVINQRNQLEQIGSTPLKGTVALDGRTVTYSNLTNDNILYYQVVPATISGNQMILDETNLGNVFVGEMLAGPGIPNGTTITGVLNTLSLSGKTTGSTGATLVVTNLNTAALVPGDFVSGQGIPAGATIGSISGTSIAITAPAGSNFNTKAGAINLTVTPQNAQVFTLSQTCKNSNGKISVNLEIPPLVGMTVSGPGVPAGTTIAAVPSVNTIVLSNPVTPAGGNVSLTLGLNAQQAELLQTLKQKYASEDIQDLKQQGVLEDILQGGSGNDRIYGSPNYNVWMTGGNPQNATGSHVYYNYHPGDKISGAGSDTVMFQGIASGTGAINLTYDPTTTYMNVALSTPTEVAEVGQQVALPQSVEVDSNIINVSQVGVETLGGNATVNASLLDASGNSVELPYNILVEDGGTPTNHGNITMDITQLDVPFHLVGGLGNDTFKISNTMASGTPALGSSVTPGVAANELDIQSPPIQTATVTEVNGLLWVNSTPVNQLGGTITSANTIAFPDIPEFEGLLVVGNSISAPGYIPNDDTIQSVAMSGGIITVTLTSNFLSSAPADGSPINATLGLTPRLQTLKILGSDLANATNTFSTDGWIPNVTLVGGSGSGSQNNMTATGETQANTVTMMGGSGSSVTNTMIVTGGTSTLIGGSSTNTMAVTGGTSTLFGGTGPNTYNLTGAGTYNVIGGVGTNLINASGGTATIVGGIGQNTYNIIGAGSYNVIGGAGANAFDVQCAVSGDKIWLTQQNSSTFVANGYINGAYFYASASNMNTVEADGCADTSTQNANNYLDASRMTMGVLLKGVGHGNLLFGGAGNDTLIGGSGNDELVAGNNGDRLYVSGNNSSYWGTGGNTLVYKAQPGDKNVVVYGNGLWINPTMVWGSSSSSLSGTYVPFAYVTGIATLEVEDGTGTVTGHIAQWNNSNDYPGYQAYYGGYDSTSTLTTFNYTYTGFGNQSWTYYITWSQEAINPYISVTATPNAFASTPSISFDSWTINPNTGYYDGVYVTISDTLGEVIFAVIDGSVTTTGYVTGNVWDPYLNPYWNMSSSESQYGYWNGKLTIDPGINVAPTLTVPATGPNGAVVNYPQTFTTGGASPQTSLTYSIPSGSLFPIGTTQVTATATDGAGRTSTATFNVIVLPAPSATSASSAQAVLNADQFDASIGAFVNQVAANSTFANSSTPAIQQLSSLIGLAQQDAATFQPYPAFDQEATTFLNNVVSSGQAQSSLVQQQVATIANLAANGFNGSSVTNITPTANGTVWFTCANGVLGTSTNGQAAAAVTLNNVPVQISSLVVGSNGTAWFVTTQGQIGYCAAGQTTATPDQLAQLVVSAPRSAAVGNPFALTVTALDAAGNVILDYPGTVQFSSSDQQAGLPPSYTFTSDDEGEHTFSITLSTTGSQTITVTSGSITGSTTVQVHA